MNEDIIGGTMLLTGLFVCFFGGKYFKHVIFFVGFVIGALFAYYVLGSIWTAFHSHIESTTRLYISLTVGGLMGILCVVVYKAAVLSLGAVAGVILMQMIFQVFHAYLVIPQPNVVQLVLILTGAVVGGFLAFKFVTFVLKGVTAFVGSFMFASGVSYFIERLQNQHNDNVLDFVQFFTSQKTANTFSEECDWHCYLCIVMWLALFVSGTVVQYKLHGKHNPKDFDDDISEESESAEDKENVPSSKRSSRKGTVEVGSVSPRQSTKEKGQFDYRDPPRGMQYV